MGFSVGSATTVVAHRGARFMPDTQPAMEHRRLGRSGLQVSVLSFGSWVTFGDQLDAGLARDCLEVARAGGMNFFDNAEAYAGGESERIMGRAIAELGWTRHSYVISTKAYWGIHHDVPNMVGTLNRKYLMQSIDASLDRLGLDFVDLFYCHRSDPNTPIEETVWAMSDIIAAGKALYWGTSEWSADEIRAACEIAERHHLRAPVVEQPQYNLFERRRVEREYARLYDDVGIGLTTWSPLASGLLTGKYLDGVPDDSRAALPGYEWLRDLLTEPGRNNKVRALQAVAERLECTLAQLAIAWCASNPNVSSVITGASRPEQVTDNLGALAVLPRLTHEVRAEMKDLVR
jgi:voltage-dependent potassium channel beta subunit